MNRGVMRRGFTLAELAATMSITALLIPLSFSAYRTLEAGQRQAQRQVEAVRGMRTFSETLDADLLHLTWIGDTGLGLSGPCGQVRYDVRGGVLLREGDEACGPKTQALARGLHSIERSASGVRLVWSGVQREIELRRGP